MELEQANKDVSIAKSDLSPSATLSFQATQTDDTSSSYDESDKETLIKKYFIPGDVHWNRAGHMLVFNALKKELSNIF